MGSPGFELESPVRGTCTESGGDAGPRPGQEIPVEQMTRELGARVAWATMPGWLVRRWPGCCGRPCPFWTRLGPRGCWMGASCRPGSYPGRCRGRALGRRARAAGPGYVDEHYWLRAGGLGPGHGSADPGRGATEHITELPAAAKGGGVARAWPHGPGCRRDPPPRPAAWSATYRGSPPCSGPGTPPLYRLASTVVRMVIGVRWGLRWPRRLTVLAIAVEAPNAVIHVPWVARAVQRRRPRIAAGWALVAAGSVARLRAAVAEPLR